MPIYPYQCSECGYSKDVLQKLSDKNLIICPECGEKGFTRKLTAAGFVLKGSGWYVTDFRDGQKKEIKGKKETKEKKGDDDNNQNNKKNDSSKSSVKSEKNLSTPKTSQESVSKNGKASVKNTSKSA